jgi:ATP-dependent DNA helicase RecG
VTGPITLRELADIDVGRLRGVGERKREALAAFEIENVLDLVTTYPRRWVDRTNEARIEDLVIGTEALVLVTVRSVAKRVLRNRRTMVTANVGDGTGRMQVVFFNQPWRERQLTEGLQVALFGKAEEYRGGLQMTNPIVDLIGDRTGRIVAIYPQSEKVQLNTWELAGWIENALERCQPRGVADPVPDEVRRRLHLIDRGDALRSIHLPDTMREKESARRRLAFDELLRVQLLLVMRKRALEHEARGLSHTIDGELVRRFHDHLPYPLTGAQRRVIAEISADLAAPHPMHRLLQGDVGSGKTVVAVSTMLTAVQGGHQGALMAPTEVLAEQHASSVRSLLDGVTVPDPDNLFGDRPLRVELLTNRIGGADRREVIAGLADGTVDIAIGTHALIQEGVAFHSLGAVVVDEQHRFGVEQRAALRDKSSGGVPDLLVMTATPIPRTAAMTVYGDLDVSVLDELPPGRTPIETRWANGGLLEAEVWADVREQVAAGRQAYVVCPLIDESEKLEVASAEETYLRLAAGELSGLGLGLLHGRLTPADKEMTMDLFRAGRLDVLVATTVIEVGVDVPNANIMVIEHAERFGLAQLHQLRGRVGRSRAASYCVLLHHGRLSEIARERLATLVGTDDGFVIAERDLELRGPGDFFGTRQSGIPAFRVGRLIRDRDLLERARSEAVRLADDPALTTGAMPAFLDAGGWEKRFGLSRVG